MIVLFLVGLSLGRSWSVLIVQRSEPHAVLVVDPVATVEVASIAATSEKANARAARSNCCDVDTSSRRVQGRPAALGDPEWPSAVVPG